jgi:hypothetical protein
VLYASKQEHDNTTKLLKAQLENQAAITTTKRMNE